MTHLTSLSSKGRFGSGWLKSREDRPVRSGSNRRADHLVMRGVFPALEVGLVARRTHFRPRVFCRVDAGQCLVLNRGARRSRRSRRGAGAAAVWSCRAGRALPEIARNRNRQSALKYRRCFMFFPTANGLVSRPSDPATVGYCSADSRCLSESPAFTPAAHTRVNRLTSQNRKN